MNETLSVRDEEKQSFELWEKLVKEKARQRERERRRLLDRLLEALDQLARDYRWEELYVFGSLIKPGRFRLDSDVDVAVRGLNKFDHFALVGGLSMLIERPVDVVMLEECPFAETIVLKGMKWQRKET